MSISAIDQALALLPKATATLSLCGSVFILQDVLRDEKKLWGSVYHRIMLGLSIFDVMSCVVNILSTWPTPADQADTIFWAAGTTATCTAQGFFNELGNITTVTYIAALTLRYVLIICYNLSETQLQNYEPLFHGLPIGIGLVMAVVGLPLDLYNNSGWLCWYAPYPRNCDLDLDDDDNNNACQRGALAPIFQWIHYAIAWTAILFVTFGMIYIYLTVRRQESRALEIRGIREEGDEEEEEGYENDQAEASEQDGAVAMNTFSFIARLQRERWHSIGRFIVSQRNNNSENHGSRYNRQSSSLIATPIASSTITTSQQEQQQQQPKRELRRTNEVAAQAQLYIFALYLTWFFTTVTRCYQTFSTQKPYVLLLLMAIFFPLQGFWNCCIYVRPIWVQRRQERERNSSRRIKRKMRIQQQNQQQQPSTSMTSSQDNVSSSSTWDVGVPTTTNALAHAAAAAASDNDSRPVSTIPPTTAEASEERNADSIGT
jgi:hypothetical protein